MTEVECYFSGPGLDAPYCRELLSYDISGGWIYFNGYFYAQDEKLPLQCTLCISQIEKEPYKVEKGVSYYKYVFQEYYLIEITCREFFENTNEYSDEIDDDGTPMQICFFPTHKIKLWFRVRTKGEPKPVLETEEHEEKEDLEIMIERMLANQDKVESTPK